HGAFAELAVAERGDVVPLHAGIDDVTAAGFAVAYGSAHGALTWRAGPRGGGAPPRTGASGGGGPPPRGGRPATGAVGGAVARGEERLAVARGQGAAHTLDSELPDLPARLKELTGGRGVDVAYDTVGGPMFDMALRAIAWEGRIVVVGFASGAVPRIPANILL